MLRIVFAAIILISLIKCTPKGQSETSSAVDSVQVAPIPADTISTYMDLQNIEVKGDSVFLTFGVGEGGDEVVLRTKSLGPVDESAVRKTSRGVDLLEPMPINYGPEDYDFTYGGEPSQHLLGEQFYLRYIMEGTKPRFVFIDIRGDYSKFYGTWKMIEEENGKRYFPTYSDAATPSLNFSSDSGDPIFNLLRGQDAVQYFVRDFTMSKYGTEGVFRLFSSDTRTEITVRTTEIVTGIYDYQYTEFSGFYEEPKKFVPSRLFDKYPERRVD